MIASHKHNPIVVLVHSLGVSSNYLLIVLFLFEAKAKIPGIDYDKPTDEDGEQYHTYFLNMVNEADLLAAMQAAGGELPECACADKCAVGAINTDCTVCAVNMGECQGKAPEPVPVVEPESDPEPEQPKNSGGTILLVLAVAVIVGVAGWYFKIYRPKKQQAADAAEDYGNDYDDTPPWEDEDETESEGEE